MELGIFFRDLERSMHYFHGSREHRPWGPHYPSNFGFLHRASFWFTSIYMLYQLSVTLEGCDPEKKKGRIVRKVVAS